MKDYEPSKRSEKMEANWGGGRARRLLFAAYTIAFMCLLRVDEVLKIQAHDITMVGPTCMKVSLPFQKTHQCGGMSPIPIST